MRHKVKGRHLGRTPSHRLAMMRNLAMQLFVHGRIKTTVAKAKELRPFAERLITIAKKASAQLELTESETGEKAAQARAAALYGRRRLIQLLGGKKIHVVKDEPIDVIGEKLLGEIGPRFQDRPGGYTRILKLTERRLGDAAPTAYIELVGAMKAAEEPVTPKVEES